MIGSFDKIKQFEKTGTKGKFFKPQINENSYLISKQEVNHVFRYLLTFAVV